MGYIENILAGGKCEQLGGYPNRHSEIYIMLDGWFEMSCTGIMNQNISFCILFIITEKTTAKHAFPQLGNGLNERALFGLINLNYKHSTHEQVNNLLQKKRHENIITQV